MTKLGVGTRYWVLGTGYWVLDDRGKEIIVIADINGASGHSNAHACTSHSTGHIML